MKPFFISAIALLTLFSCSKNDRQKELGDPADSLSVTPSATTIVLTDAQLKSIKIQTGFPEQRQMNDVVKASGLLDVPPQNLVTISAPLGGFVRQTELLEGMKVQKGQTLIIMEHPDYIQMQQDYLEGISQLEFLSAEYKRQQDLAAENVNALKTLQQSKSNYLSMKAKMEGLDAKLRLIGIDPKEVEKGKLRNTISILSPITGFVSQVHINVGMHVNSTDVLLKIVDTEHLHAEAQVFEKDIPRLAIGQVVRILLTGESTERTAKVYLIGKEITPERTVRVHCHLTKEDPGLIPGMYFTAFIETGGTQATVLPNEALVNFEGRDYVFIADVNDSQRFELVEISQGLSDNRYTVVEIPEAYAKMPMVINGAYSLLGLLKNKEE